MNRRNTLARLLGLLGSAALAPRLAAGQPAERKVVRLAIIATGGKRGETPFYVAFERRLKELGHIEGKNLTLSWHHAAPVEKIAERVEQLARFRPDIVVASGSEQVLRSVRRAVGSTPIVMLAIDFDPVEKNHVASLAHPGGNITGLFLRQVETAAKRLQLLKEALPGASRVAVLWDSYTRDQLQFIDEPAKKLDLVLLPYEMRGSPYDFEAPLKGAKAQNAQAVLALTSGAFFAVRRQMLAAANAQGLPVVANTNYAESGALIAFSASFSHMFERAAEYVDRIARGAKPGEIPVEQPDRYDLIVNLKTARALDIKVPHSLLVRANRVIE